MLDGIIIIIIVAIGFILLILGVDKAAIENKYDNMSLEDDCVKVITKRTNVSGGRGSTTYYFITFEFEKNGNRQEFQVSGNTFGLIAEGDRGTLSYKEDRFIKFDRIIA